jgi:hypothetical protein
MPANATCEGCGFRWSEVTADEVPSRVSVATSSFVHVIETAGANANARPSPERWSILEYAGHMRDVFISIRERIMRACVEDEPVGTPMYREERVNLGLYRLDTPSIVAKELTTLSALFARTFQSLPEPFLERRLTYSTVTPAKVTILWAGAQAVHEVEHHLADAQENLRLLRA